MTLRTAASPDGGIVRNVILALLGHLRVSADATEAARARASAREASSSVWRIAIEATTGIFIRSLNLPISAITDPLAQV